jgi:hypothetical protein
MFVGQVKGKKQKVIPMRPTLQCNGVAQQARQETIAAVSRQGGLVGYRLRTICVGNQGRRVLLSYNSKLPGASFLSVQALAFNPKQAFSPCFLS